MRAHTALKAEEAEVDGQEVCFTPLPTPEEKMRQQAQAILTDIVPINVTGKNHSLMICQIEVPIFTVVALAVISL